MIAINHINDRQIWDDFVIKNTSDTFLQSWDWGEFNLSLGNPIWRLGLYYQDNLKLVLLVLKIKAKRGSFLFVPHGPIFDQSLLKSTIDPGQTDPDIKEAQEMLSLMKGVLEELKKIAIGEGCTFIRVAPTLKKTSAATKLFNDLGLKEAPIHIHSELSWVLNITKPEELLLSEMRKTTRYLIKQKDRSGVFVEKSKNIEDLDKFYDLYKKTERRQNFTAFGPEYLKKEFAAFLKHDGVALYFAYANKELLAAAFIIRYGYTGFNHHAASTLKYPKIPASYILHWEIIKDLKSQGISFYNFWGIAPEDKPNHPWQGITLFKKGFGGESREYAHTKDYILRWDYAINWTVETARRIKRRY